LGDFLIRRHIGDGGLCHFSSAVIHHVKGDVGGFGAHIDGHVSGPFRLRCSEFGIVQHRSLTVISLQAGKGVIIALIRRTEKFIPHEILV